MAAAVVLVVSGMVGGTVAWLVSETNTLRNTFTYGKIDIDLTETDTNQDDDNDPNTNAYQMMPGITIEKDPVVTVQPGSEPHWLFVKLEKSTNFDDFMTYEMADGWIQLTDDQNAAVEGIFYREVEKDEDNPQSFAVIKENEITVKTEVTGAQFNALTEETCPTLNVTAYAVQKTGVDTAAQAWKLAEEQLTAQP